MLNAIQLNKRENKAIDAMNYLNDFIEDFLYDCKVRSKATYNNYKSDLNKIAIQMFNKTHYKYLTKEDFENLSIDDVIFYFKSLSQEQDEKEKQVFSNQTINRQISSFKSLIKYLQARGKVDFPVNQMLVLVKSLPKSPESIDVFSIEDSEKCIKILSNFVSGDIYSKAAKLSVDTALRASEILNLTWNQFTIENDLVIIKSNSKNKGKGNKDFRHVISKDFYNEILELKQQGIEKVFNISYSSLSKAMLKAIKQMNLSNKNYSFHSFRKRSISNIMKLTGDIQAAKNKAGHSSIATTEIYLEENNYELTGYYSLNDNIDQNSYLNASKEELIKAIKSLGPGFIHNINVKLNKKGDL